LEYLLKTTQGMVKFTDSNRLKSKTIFAGNGDSEDFMLLKTQLTIVL